MRKRFACAVVAALLGSGLVWAQAPSGTEKTTGDMAARCQEMMKHHKQMMGEMQQMDTRLSQLVDKMNSAKGNDRLDAVVAVLNEMAQQRRQMADRMAAMPMMMMGHAMDHMAAGGMSADCPMMKGSGAERAKGPGGSEP